VRRDPGLAPERTGLAWQRFALALAVVGALGLRAGLAHRHEILGFALAAVTGAAAAVLQLSGPRLTPERAVRLALTATLTAAAGAFALALS
jgi:uncharacterized membrane protein YidH (DUF202 family)